MNFGIDEERLRLHGAGHQHAVGVEDAAAAGCEGFGLMLLTLGAAMVCSRP